MNRNSMPREIISVFLLLFSTIIVMFLGTYLDLDFYSESGDYDPYIYTVDFLVSICLIWLAWEIGSKKKDIKSVFLILPIVIFFMNIWNYFDHGLRYLIIMGLFEVVFFVRIYFLLNSNNVALWQKETL